MGRNFDLSKFRLASDKMIQINDRYSGRYQDEACARRAYKTYTVEDVRRIINEGTLSEQINLSRAFFQKDGFYKRILIYYATLLRYANLLIPNPSIGKSLSNPGLFKKYRAALKFKDNLSVEEWLTNCSISVLRDGAYYGFITKLDRDEFLKIDLPVAYCRNYLKDVYGNNIVEFNVTYFDSITDEQLKKDALDLYPKLITLHYRKYQNGKVKTPWVILPGDLGFCFNLFGDNRPLFLNVIPSTIQYDDTVDTERERDLEEIRKILVQKIPHNSENQLLFEPDEALEMHQGAVNMLRSNKNLSVLTTYADVDAIVSKTSSDAVSNNLEKMVNNIYYEASASPLLFAPTGTSSLDTSIKNDVSLMMSLANQYARLIGFLVNQLYGNSAIRFTFRIFPITEYNSSQFITDTFKLAQSGYSLLLPCLASGISQAELNGLKDLENEGLELGKKLIPLASAYTQSSANGSGAGPGRPSLPEDKKSEKTIQNEESIDRQGGID